MKRKIEEKYYDIIVVGAGHAGVEAAFSGARKGKKVLLATISLNAISFMACNPNIGGTAKGTLVKEIDALGGEMGKVADLATIQARMLNLANGPAVHSLRCQVDKEKYQRRMKYRLEKEKNIDLLECEINSILLENGKVIGATTLLGDTYMTKAVILTTGVYMNARIIIGEFINNCGPSGFLRSEKLSDNLKKMGLPITRFKTGTPQRILGSSVDFSKMEVQNGDIGIPKFSQMSDFEVNNTHKCYLTYTNKNTHKIIMDNIDRAPLFNGSIGGVGPRYCPSIEGKLVKFADKERHQIFIEPEGAETDEMYVQGLSTSLPYDVQEDMLHSIVGLENAKIMRYGYAIEYDCLDPACLLPSLAVKGFEELCRAGKINESSGYEEAAAQGIIAGINAVAFIDNEEPFILGRDEAYIGVLIDDQVTKGTEEPYRMMTSRAEYRLNLRQDNADLRLTQKGRDIGLVDDERYKRYLKKLEDIKNIKEMLKKSYSPKRVQAIFEKKEEPLPKGGISGRAILKRSTLNHDDLIEIDEDFGKINLELLKTVETEIKYEGYLSKQEQAIKEMKKMESKKLPIDIDYENIDGLRLEAQQKLNKIKPLSLAQASRISGVNPADIVVLMVYLTKKSENKNG